MTSHKTDLIEIITVNRIVRKTKEVDKSKTDQGKIKEVEDLGRCVQYK